jgi:hypothetical protein
MNQEICPPTPLKSKAWWMVVIAERKERQTLQEALLPSRDSERERWEGGKKMEGPSVEREGTCGCCEGRGERGEEAGRH